MGLDMRMGLEAGMGMATAVQRGTGEIGDGKWYYLGYLRIWEVVALGLVL